MLTYSGRGLKYSFLLRGARPANSVKQKSLKALLLHHVSDIIMRLFS